MEGEGRHTGSTGQQLVQNYLHGIEPVHPPRLAATGDFIPVPCTEIPQPHLVEVMQSQCASDAVDQDRIWHRERDDVAQVKLDKIY